MKGWKKFRKVPENERLHVHIFLISQGYCLATVKMCSKRREVSVVLFIFIIHYK